MKKDMSNVARKPNCNVRNNLWGVKEAWCGGLSPTLISSVFHIWWVSGWVRSKYRLIVAANL